MIAYLFEWQEQFLLLLFFVLETYKEKLPAAAVITDKVRYPFNKRCGSSLRSCALQEHRESSPIAETD
jgi:hypothetical protein